MPETTRTRRFLAFLARGRHPARPWLTVAGPEWLRRILIAAGAQGDDDDA
jgi:hypothetical protein